MNEIRVNLPTYYEKMYLDARDKIAAGSYTLDELIDAKTDKRFGLTLIARPPQHVLDEVHSFLDAVRQIEPEQYFYPGKDLHITVLSVVSCYDGFSLEELVVKEYVEVINKCIGHFGTFNIDFTGITASPGAAMLRGMPAGDILNSLRDALRKEFKSSTLFHTIDKRYTIFTAHSTVLRFRKPLRNPQKFLLLLEKFRNHSFGAFHVAQVDLVFNDWYQRSGAGKLLHRFHL